jgi:PilZ domain-containing protein
MALMNNRSNQRYQVLKAGTISFEDSKIDCAVHDLSLGGASLEVDSHVRIPDTFDLLIADTGKQRCQVIWRKEARVGVAFS